MLPDGRPVGCGSLGVPNLDAVETLSYLVHQVQSERRETRVLECLDAEQLEPSGLAIGRLLVAEPTDLRLAEGTRLFRKVLDGIDKADQADALVFDLFRRDFLVFADRRVRLLRTVRIHSPP